jgi:hypothetical protein
VSRPFGTGVIRLTTNLISYDTAPVVPQKPGNRDQCGYSATGLPSPTYPKSGTHARVLLGDSGEIPIEFAKADRLYHGCSNSRFHGRYGRIYGLKTKVYYGLKRAARLLATAVTRAGSNRSPSAGANRFHVAFINQHHITERFLNEAISIIAPAGLRHPLSAARLLSSSRP